MDTRFDVADRRVDTIDRRFDTVDGRIDVLDEKRSRQFVWLVGLQATTRGHRQCVTGSRLIW